MFKTKAIEIELGTVPAAESCAQVDHKDYSERSRRECAVYIRLLRRVFNEPNPGLLTFVRRSFPHGLGRYNSVVAVMTTEGAMLFDQQLVPHEWDHIARAELTWLRLRQKWCETVHARPSAKALVPDIFLHHAIPNFPNHPAAIWWAMGYMPIPANYATAVQ